METSVELTFMTIKIGKVYTVLDKKDNYLITIDFSHPVFEGHFLKNPILPGVMMCDIIRDIVSEKSGVRVQLLFAKSIKFTRVIVPSENNTYKVTIVMVNEEDEYNVRADVSQDNDTYFKINAKYKIK